MAVSMSYKKKKTLRKTTPPKNFLPATKKTCQVSSTNTNADKSPSNAKVKEPKTLTKATPIKTTLTQKDTLRRRFSPHQTA